MSHLYLVLPCAWAGKPAGGIRRRELDAVGVEFVCRGRIDLELDLVIGIGQHDLLVRIRFARENATRELDDDAAIAAPATPEPGDARLRGTSGTRRLPMTSSAVAIGKRVENPAISRSMARGRSRARGQRG